VIWDQADACEPDMIVRDDTVFGALALVAPDYAYIVGDTNMGAPWQLAEVHLPDRTLTPVITYNSAWNWNNWIEVKGDEVSVFEFYPGSGKLTFNRATRQVYQQESAPPDAIAPYPYDGALINLYIGRGEDDICKNVCIVRDNLTGAQPVTLLDDGEEDFSITNILYFFGDHAYFMTYQSVFNSPGNPTFRRLNLRTGGVEVVFSFDGPRANAWVHAPQRGPDGYLYWLRHEQATLDSPWLVYIDRYNASTNQNYQAFIRGLGGDARDLSINSGYFLWSDTGRVFTAPLSAGATPRVLAAHDPNLPADGTATAYYKAEQGRVYYTLSWADGRARSSRFGCATLAP
jgi:hypothetical protein